jgi:hypothetical protein
MMQNFLFNKWTSIFSILLLLFCTYFRENLLLEINAYIKDLEYSRAYSFWFSSYFSDLSKAKLYQLKWITTIFFSVLMSLLTIFSLHSWFLNKQFTQLLIFIYTILAGVILIISIIAFIVGEFSDVYFVLRKALGIVQSPIPCFAFFALFYYTKKSK